MSGSSGVCSGEPWGRQRSQPVPMELTESHRHSPEKVQPSCSLWTGNPGSSLYSGILLSHLQQRLLLVSPWEGTCALRTGFRASRGVPSPQLLSEAPGVDAGWWVGVGKRRLLFPLQSSCSGCVDRGYRQPGCGPHILGAVFMPVPGWWEVRWGSGCPALP